MIKVERMKLKHIEQVYAIEKDSFSIPWTREDFRKEVEENERAIYVVAVEGVKVLGYGGMWHIVNEGHITNVAVKEECRKKGIGSMILEELIKISIENEMIGITLEVRVGNSDAMKLYSKYGFKVEGYRKNYYSDTREDAIVMWKYNDK